MLQALPDIEHLIFQNLFNLLKINKYFQRLSFCIGHGMMEDWKLGMMGLKVFYYFYKKACSAFMPNNPFFHHSTIPYYTANLIAIKYI